MTPVIEPRGIARPARALVRTVAVAIVAAVVLAGAGLALASRPSYFSRYSGLERRYTTLQSSAHRGLACGECHAATGPVQTGAARVGDFYSGLVGSPGEPMFTRFSAPTSAACLRCHRDDWSMDASTTAKLPHPAHLRVASEKRPCVTCHKWVAHEEAYQAKHKTMPFSAVCAGFGCHVGTKTKAECSTCHHVLVDKGVDWKRAHPETVRSQGANGCLERCHDASQCRLCHTTGRTPDVASNVATAGVGEIERLHVRKDWLSKHGGLAIQDRSQCSKCHVSDGECADCHAQRPAFHGSKATWLARHKPLAKDTRRCLACHEKPWCDACHRQFKEMR